MPEKLKPCPACGTPGDTLEVYPVKDGFYQVGCWDCFMRGTRLLSPDKAIKAWNALPRRLRWTNEPPKEPGWYWWRTDKWNDAQIVFVDRWIFCKTHRLGFSAKFLKNWKKEHDVAALDGEWAGPIPEPEE